MPGGHESVWMSISQSVQSYVRTDEVPFRVNADYSGEEHIRTGKVDRGGEGVAAAGIAWRKSE